MEFYNKKSLWSRGKEGFLSYFEWFREHKAKQLLIFEKLAKEKKSKKEIVEYFKYENMQKNEPNFCPLYAMNEKCHEMEHLNCYFCACPYFRFDDEGIKEENGLCVKSECAIKSKKSSLFVHEGVAHLDCSKCTTPHGKKFVLSHLK